MISGKEQAAHRLCSPPQVAVPTGYRAVESRYSFLMMEARCLFARERRLNRMRFDMIQGRLHVIDE